MLLLFGRGIVGGPLYPVQQVSREAVHVALRLLNGQSADDMEPVFLDSTTPVYDWRELQRWNIAENRLPPGSAVRFREASVWQEYKWLIIFVLSLCILEAALIDILLRERRRRRLTQQQLEERLRFERLVAELSGTFIDLPPERVEGRIVEALGQIANFFKFDIAALSVFTGRGAEGRVAFLWRAEGVPEIPSNLTDKDFPWVAQELVAGRDVYIRDLEILPLAARVDRASYEKYHVRSVYNVRLIAAGKVIGVLSLCTAWEKRAISPELLQAQRLLGEIFANALARKAAEEARRESEERMSLAANAADLAFWTWDVSRDEVWLTPEGRALFGWTKSEPINFERFIRSIHPDDQEATREAVSRSLIGGEDYRTEYRVALSEGTTRWFVARGRVEFDRNHKPVRMRGIVIDITERKRAEEALKRSENQVRLFVEHTPASVAMFDREMRYILASRRWLKDYNLGEQHILGRSHYEVFPEIPERWKEIHRRCLAGAVETCEQDPFPRLDGTVDWVRWEVRPWYVAGDEIGGIIMFTEVITDRKQAESELQLQREELAHLTRVSAMGELAASLAHELNQPLTAILSNAQAAQRFLSASPADVEEVREILHDIVQDDNRASEVIRRMRALVKKEDLSFASLELPSVMREVISLAESDALLRNIRVSLEVEEGLPLVLGDKVQLQQVVLNLLLNAFDAMRECPTDERQVSVCANTDGVDRVEISVRDRGTGLTSDKLDKIFQPFFTTKGEGLGMGLSISRSIIEAHGGHLWAENNRDRGATFYFTVPVGGGRVEGRVTRDT